MTSEIPTLKTQSTSTVTVKCTTFGCEDTNMCLLSDDNDCIKCCEEENHDHCITCGCENLGMCLLNDDICIKCCGEENHEHCSMYKCEILDLCPFNLDSVCIDHCKGKSHKH